MTEYTSIDKIISQIQYNQLFINGVFCNSSHGETFETICPYTGNVITNIQQASPEDIDRTVPVAREAFQKWRKISASTRSKYLYKLAKLIKDNAQFIANLDTLENGIPINDMFHSAMAAAEILYFYAGTADKVKGETIPVQSEQDNLMTITVREPLGICAIIIPWNSPTLMLAKTIGPALAAGNTVIVKPAEQTSLSALFIANLTRQIGLPGGVFNVLTGDGPNVGARLAEHMDIDKITFTGSTQVGQSIMAASARSNLKRVTLELGGKSPLVVFDDCEDIDKVARLAHNAVMVSNGQICCCGSRTYVQEKIYDEFVEACARIANERTLGNPLNPEIQQGPQVEKQAVNKIMSMIESGLEEGARLVTGGQRGLNDGQLEGLNENGTDELFIQPTVFAEVDESMLIGREEIFGPVQCIMKFKTLDEIIERANRTKFGLAAGIVTQNINRALRFAREVRAGTCWVNCYFIVRPQTPFGGYKMSGFGREFGEKAMDDYLETKTITINLSNQNLLFG